MRYSPLLTLILTLFISALAGTISGCTTVQSTPNKAIQGAMTRQYNETLKLSGRIQISYQKDEKAEVLPGNFEWQQDAHNTHISLFSPFGQTLAEIHVDAAGASLQQADRPTQHADNLDQLLSQSLGWQLPVIGLRDWLQGFARTNQESHQRTALNREDGLKVSLDGWNIQFVSWSEDPIPHPKRIDLRRYLPEIGEVSIKIVINQWEPL